MGLKQTIAPASLAVSVNDFKDHAYIAIDTDDTLISSMLETSTKQLEDYTGLQLVDATYIQTCDKWSDIITLSKSPVKSITSITYYDVDNVQQTLDPTIYELDDFEMPNRLVRDIDKSLPDIKNKVNTIQITYVAGFDTIPQQLKSWIKIQASTFYENRENFTSVKLSVLPDNFTDRLLDSYKVL